MACDAWEPSLPSVTQCVSSKRRSQQHRRSRRAQRAAQLRLEHRPQRLRCKRLLARQDDSQQLLSVRHSTVQLITQSAHHRLRRRRCACRRDVGVGKGRQRRVGTPTDPPPVPSMPPPPQRPPAAARSSWCRSMLDDSSSHPAASRLCSSRCAAMAGWRCRRRSNTSSSAPGESAASVATAMAMSAGGLVPSPACW